MLKKKTHKTQNSDISTDLTIILNVGLPTFISCQNNATRLSFVFVLCQSENSPASKTLHWIPTILQLTSKFLNMTQQSPECSGSSL